MIRCLIYYLLLGQAGILRVKNVITIGHPLQITIQPIVNFEEVIPNPFRSSIAPRHSDTCPTPEDGLLSKLGLQVFHNTEFYVRDGTLQVWSRVPLSG